MAMNNRTLRPRASGFNPKSLPGFVYWLDASQSSTITVETGVAEWRDAGGSAIKAAQTAANNQPAYQTAQQNGKNAVYFDGTNDTMGLGDLSASFPSAATAPRDGQGRIVVAVHDQFAEFPAAAAMLPDVLASGAVEEISEATYTAALKRTP